MKKKAKYLILFNFIFYIFIVLHNFYVDDNVPQVLFYMSLFFSTIVLEQTYRNRIDKLKTFSLIDFLIRVVVLIIHFATLIFNFDILKINAITTILFIVNIIIEGIIVNKVKDMKEDKVKEIQQKDINKFIDDFYSGNINYYVMGIDLKGEVTNIIKATEISGKNTIILIISFILLFTSRFIYEHFTKFVFIGILLIVPLVYILFKLSYKMISIVYSDDKERKRRNYLNMITFLIGYVILFVSEVIFYGKMVY